MCRTHARVMSKATTAHTWVETSTQALLDLSVRHLDCVSASAICHLGNLPPTCSFAAKTLITYLVLISSLLPHPTQLAPPSALPQVHRHSSNLRPARELDKDLALPMWCSAPPPKHSSLRTKPTTHRIMVGGHAPAQIFHREAAEYSTRV